MSAEAQTAVPATPVTLFDNYIRQPQHLPALRVAVATIFGQPAQAALPRIVLQFKSDGIDLRS